MRYLTKHLIMSLPCIYSGDIYSRQDQIDVIKPRTVINKSFDLAVGFHNALAHIQLLLPFCHNSIPWNLEECVESETQALCKPGYGGTMGYHPFRHEQPVK